MAFSTPGTRTVLFTDLVGSTILRTRLGDVTADELRREHDDILARAVVRHGGTRVKNTGDGVMAVFESAAEGVACAVEMQQLVDRYRRDRDLPIAIRVGLSAGDIAFERNDYFGTPVVEAARLEAAAAGDQILVSDVVRLLAGTRTDLKFLPVGPLDLKGLAAPLSAYDVPWEPNEHVSAARTDEWVTGDIGFPAALTLSGSQPCVGREELLTSLDARWQDVLRGRSDFVALGGEPGIGKSRLAAEFAAHVHRAGGLVLFGRCDEAAPQALQPIAEAVSECLRDVNVEMIGRQLGWVVRALTPLVPRLAGADTETPPWPGDQRALFGVAGERFVVFEAVAELVRRLAVEAPLLLVVDDLHWATEPTVSALRHMLHRCLDSPVMVLGTYRDTELGRGEPFARALVELRGEGIVTRLAVRGLEASAIGTLAATMVDVTDTTLVQRVHEQTRGNPFFATELLRSVAEHGSDPHLPEGIKEAIGLRLSRLPESVTRVLRVAAVAGPSFTVRLLEQIPAAANGVDALLDAVDLALDEGLIVEQRRADDRYEFAHALIRQVLYDEVSSARRARLHSDVAQALEREGALSNENLASLAFHYTEAAHAGHLDKAVEYSLRAAEAIVTVAAEDSIAIVQRALDVVSLAPGSETAQADLLIFLCSPLRLCERWTEARRACLDAISLARTLRDGRRIAQAVDAYTRCQELGRPDAQVSSLIGEALAALDAGNPGLRARLLVASADQMLFAGGDWHATWPLLQQATELTHEGADAHDRFEVFWMALRHIWASPLAEEQQSLLDEFEVVEAALPPSLARRRLHLVFDARLKLELGDPEFASSLESWIALHQDATDLNTIGWRDYLSAARSLMHGKFDDAEFVIQSILARGTESNDRSTVALAQLFLLYRERGRVGEILSLAIDAIEQNPGLAGFRAAVALAHADLGDVAAAQQVFVSLSEDGFGPVPRDMTWTGSLVVLAEICAILSDADHAPALTELLEPYAGRMVVIADLALAPAAADRGLGQLATVMRRWDDAEAHYRNALEIETRLQARPLVARTQYWYARMLLDRGRDEDAMHAFALLRSSQAEAEELGMKTLSADIAFALAGATDLPRHTRATSAAAGRND